MSSRTSCERSWILQGLAGWCLSYCRDQNIKDVASGSVITTAHTSTRLDLDAGPAKGIQHQVNTISYDS